MNTILEKFDSLPFIRTHIEEHGYAVQDNIDLYGLIVQFWCPDIKLAILINEEGNKNNRTALKQITQAGIKILIFNQQFVTAAIIAKRLQNITIDILTIESVLEFPKKKLDGQAFQEYLLMKQLKGQGYKVTPKGNLLGFDFSLMLSDFGLIVQVDNLSNNSAEQIEHQRIKLKTFRSNGYPVIQVTHKQINASLRHVLASINQAIVPIEKKLRRKEKSEKRLQEKLKKQSLRQTTPRRLVNDPNWEALACKKLGIDPAKPKRTPINA